VKNYKRLDERLDLSIHTKGEENVRMERKDVIVEKTIDGRKKWSYQSLKKKYYTHERKNLPNQICSFLLGLKFYCSWV